MAPRNVYREAQEKIFALAPDAPADARARGYDLRERRGEGHPVDPVQAVVEQQLLPGLRLVGGVPERDDVVGRFVIGRQFDQIERAFGPATLRLDPDIGTALVIRRVVLVMIEVAIALQQPEAARILILIRVEAYAARVGKRPPDPFPLAVPQREAVRIVDLRTPVAAWRTLAASAL